MIPYANRYSIKSPEFQIEKAFVEPWSRSKTFAADVTRGVVVNLNLPQLDSDEMKLLFEKYGIDHWVLRVRKRSGSFGNSILGYVKVPFFTKGHRSGNLRAMKIYEASIMLAYSADLAVVTSETLRCPPLEHRKKITEFKLDEGELREKTWVTIQNRKLSTLLLPLDIKPISIDSGKSLRGDYQFDLALFASNGEDLFGEFEQATGSLEIIEEEDTYIQGCVGSDPNPPTKESIEQKMKFKFGN